MPNKQSAKKELRKNVKRNAANKKVAETMKKSIKAVVKAITTGDKKAKEDIYLTIKTIDKATKKGIIKKNTASHKKSKLQKKVNTLK